MKGKVLLKQLERLGVELRANGDHLEYEGPEEEITPELLNRLRENKPSLIKLLEWERLKQEEAHRRGFLAKLSREHGWISLHDPTSGEWHDFPARDCFPSIVAEARARRKGGAA
jgi:TubC N-terminal docking domain